MPARKPKPLPDVRIGGFVPDEPARHSRDDDRDFDAIGRRAAGESFDIKKSKSQTHGTHERPRLRERDQREVRTTTIHVDAEVLRGVRVLCTQQDLTLSKWIELQMKAALGKTG